MGINELGNRVGNWQRQVSVLHFRLMGMQAIGLQHLLAADAIRLRREIAAGLEMCRREWDAIDIPAPRRALVEKSCMQLIQSLEEIERTCGPARLDLN